MLCFYLLWIILVGDFALVSVILEVIIQRHEIFQGIKNLQYLYRSSWLLNLGHELDRVISWREFSASELHLTIEGFVVEVIDRDLLEFTKLIINVSHLYSRGCLEMSVGIGQFQDVCLDTSLHQILYIIKTLRFFKKLPFSVVNIDRS